MADVRTMEGLEAELRGNFLFGCGFFTAAAMLIVVHKISKMKIVSNLRGVLRGCTNLLSSGTFRHHKMVIVVRTDLGMGKGKIAAQCCHAAVQCYKNALKADKDDLKAWELSGGIKVCLKADGYEDSLRSLKKRAESMGVVTALIRDAGHTQVDPGTITVLGIGPATISEIDAVTGHLKLL